MTNEEKPKSFWTSIPGILTGIAAIITAIVSLFGVLNRNEATDVNKPELSPTPVTETRGEESPPSTPPSTPDSLSRTAYSLPGDAILHFRVAEIQGRELTVEVDYRYNEQHGQQVMVGASLRGVGSSYTPTFVPSPLEGTATLQMSVSEPGTSTDIDIFLYEWGRPAEKFAQRVFPYQMRFE